MPTETIIEQQMVGSWPLGPGVTVIVVLALVAAVAWLYQRQPGLQRWQRILLTGLRSSALLVALWMLGQWSMVRFASELPEVLLLVDATQSMAAADGTSERSRWEHAEELARQAVSDRGLQGRYHLRPFLIGEQLSSWEQDAGGDLATVDPRQEQSRLGDGLRAALARQRGRPTAAIALLSDGIVTAGERLEVAAQEAQRQGIPLHIVGLGDERPPPDVVVEDATSEPVVFVGEIARISATITTAGLSATRIPLRIVNAAGETLVEQMIEGGTEARRQTVELELPAEEPGRLQLVVEVPPQPGETSIENNRAALELDVRDESIRVLLLQQYPSYEFRFLKHLLERATAPGSRRNLILLTTYLVEGDPQYADQDQSAVRLPPASRDELAKFDVFVLGDIDPGVLGSLTLELIAQQVTERGAGLLLIAGPRYSPWNLRGTPLEPLLPVRLSELDASEVSSLDDGFLPTLHPTAIGTLDWSADERLPVMNWLATARSVQPAARVVLEGQSVGAANFRLPLAVTQFAGAGQVWLQLTDEFFRLATVDGEARMHETYWLHAIRTLARSKLLGGSDSMELVVSGRRFTSGDAVPFRVRIVDPELLKTADSVEVSVQSPDGDAQIVRLSANGQRRGVFEGAVEGLPAGSFRAVVVRPVSDGDPPATTFVVQRPTGEQQRLAADLSGLAQAASISGGRFYRSDEAEKWLDELPEGRRIRQQPLPPKPLWNHPLAAGLLVGLLTSEWLLRRRWALP